MTLNNHESLRQPDRDFSTTTRPAFFADWEHPVFDGPEEPPCNPAHKPHGLKLNTEGDE